MTKWDMSCSKKNGTFAAIKKVLNDERQTKRMGCCSKWKFEKK